jgi:hypothetical protein
VSGVWPAIVLPVLILALIGGVAWAVNRRGPDELVGAAARRMRRLRAAVRTYCREEVTAAVVCNLDGEPDATALPDDVKKAADDTGLGCAADSLPSPVLLAANDQWVYAFHCTPTLFGARIKRQLQRWSRDDLEVFVGAKYTDMYLVLGTRSGTCRVFEVGTLHAGPARLFTAFVQALGVK